MDAPRRPTSSGREQLPEPLWRSPCPHRRFARIRARPRQRRTTRLSHTDETHEKGGIVGLTPAQGIRLRPTSTLALKPQPGCRAVNEQIRYLSQSYGYEGEIDLVCECTRP